MRRVSAFALALLVAGCSTTPAPSGPAEQPSESRPASTVAELPAPSGAEELGLTEPSAALAIDLTLAHVGTSSVTFVDPATVGQSEIDVAEVTFDGAEVWRTSVPVPDGTVPRLSTDLALGATGLWFTPADAEASEGTWPVSGEIHWFTRGGGESGTIAVDAADGEAFATSSVIGYHLKGAGDSPLPSEYVFLGPEHRERTVTREEIGDPFNILGVWGGQFWGVMGREAIVAETGVLARMSGEAQYGFWPGEEYFHVNSTAGHVRVFDAQLTPVFEAIQPCAEDEHPVTIALGTVTVGGLVGNLADGSTECVELPDGFELGTAAPDGWAILRAEEGAEGVKVGRLGEGSWTDLPADTAPRFFGSHVVFVAPTDGDWSDSTLTAYPVSQFSPAS